MIGGHVGYVHLSGIQEQKPASDTFTRTTLPCTESIQWSFLAKCLNSTHGWMVSHRTCASLYLKTHTIFEVCKDVSRVIVIRQGMSILVVNRDSRRSPRVADCWTLLRLPCEKVWHVRGHVYSADGGGIPLPSRTVGSFQTMRSLWHTSRTGQEYLLS